MTVWVPRLLQEDLSCVLPELEVDYTPLFLLPYSSLPEDLKLWEQKSSWLLDPETRHKIKEAGGTAVAKSLDKDRLNSSITWRVSLNSASLFDKLMKHLNPGCKVKKVLKLIKDIKMVALKKADQEFLKSYNVRQTVLWCLHDRQDFSESSLLLDILSRLSTSLQQACLPSFLEVHRNLLHKLSPARCQEGHLRLQEVIRKVDFWVQRVHEAQLEQRRGIVEISLKLQPVLAIVRLLPATPNILAATICNNMTRDLFFHDGSGVKRLYFDDNTDEPLTAHEKKYGRKYKSDQEGLKDHVQKLVKASIDIFLDGNNTTGDKVVKELKDIDLD